MREYCKAVLGPLGLLTCCEMYIKKEFIKLWLKLVFDSLKQKWSELIQQNKQP